jgi:hypothetical protein
MADSDDVLLLRPARPRSAFTLEGRRPPPGALAVRFEWKDITPSSARWEQAFSFDGGQSFTTNWVMRFTRTA